MTGRLHADTPVVCAHDLPIYREMRPAAAGSAGQDDEQAVLRRDKAPSRLKMTPSKALIAASVSGSRRPGAASATCWTRARSSPNGHQMICDARSILGVSVTHIANPVTADDARS